MYQSIPISHLTQSVERARANHAEAKFKFDLALATVLVRLERFVHESTRSYCENFVGFTNRCTSKCLVVSTLHDNPYGHGKYHQILFAYLLLHFVPVSM